MLHRLILCLIIFAYAFLLYTVYKNGTTMKIIVVGISGVSISGANVYYFLAIRCLRLKREKETNRTKRIDW
jgi:hypothetical protein